MPAMSWSVREQRRARFAGSAVLLAYAQKIAGPSASGLEIDFHSPTMKLTGRPSSMTALLQFVAETGKPFCAFTREVFRHWRNGKGADTAEVFGFRCGQVKLWVAPRYEVTALTWTTRSQLRVLEIPEAPEEVARQLEELKISLAELGIRFPEPIQKHTGGVVYDELELEEGLWPFWPVAGPSTAD